MHQLIAPEVARGASIFPHCYADFRSGGDSGEVLICKATAPVKHGTLPSTSHFEPMLICLAGSYLGAVYLSRTTPT